MILNNLRVDKNLSIKKFNLKYINSNYFNWFKDKQVKMFIDFSPKNIEQLKRDCLEKMGSSNKNFLAIEFQNEHIGNILIHNINYKKKSCNIGILIGKRSLRNKKIGTKILKYLVKKIFLQKKINKIYLGVKKKNDLALKAYFNVGFKVFKEKKNIYILVLKDNIFNKLILGTVQFGMPYGISNKVNRKVSVSEQKKIFNLCAKFDVNEIDTAESYNFDLNILPKNNKWLVNTKIQIGKFSNKQKILNYLKSLKRKNVILNCLYIHDETNLFTTRGRFVMNILYKLKRKRLFNKIGISIYNFNNLNSIIKNFKIDSIQVPFNILDRQIKKYTKILKKNNIDIHARSIFLQGLLLMKPETIPEAFSEIKKFILKIKERKKFFNTNLINYLLNFVDKQHYINKIIFGVHSYNHLKKIIEYKKLQKIRFEKFNIVKKKIINPSLWLYNR